jgi:hypothetical protein
VLPLALTGDWSLITRPPVFEVMNSTPYVNESGNPASRYRGLDTILATLISPSPRVAGPWLRGAGPSFIFPTASNSRLGQNKWQIGPAAYSDTSETSGSRECFPSSGSQSEARVRRPSAR